MKKLIWILLAIFVLTACGKNKDETNIAETQDAKETVYVNITAQEAKEIMDSQEGYIILDTRAQEEYDEGHIPGAINIPNEAIGTTEIPKLPKKDQLILVYCRSGNRSKQASGKLAALGYTNIVEFGGINSWPGEIVAYET